MLLTPISAPSPTHPCTMADVLPPDGPPSHRTGDPAAASATTDPAGSPSITPPSTSINHLSEAGNEDFLVIGYGVSWDPEYFDELATWLDEQKELVQQEGGQFKHCGIAICGDTLRVQPNGAKSKNGPTYRWRLKGNGLTMLIMNRSEPSQQTPNVIIECSGDQIMSHLCGDNAYRNMEHALATICGANRGSRKAFEKLSRVDICADLPGVSVNEFLQPWLENQFVSRAKKRTIHVDEQQVMAFDIHHYGRSITGLSVGQGGNRMMRIYDKLKETEKNESKRQAMVEYRWGGNVPKCASRCEFQLRRPALKEYGVETYEDYRRKRPEIAKHLTTEWFRFVQSYNATNTSRMPVHPVWEQVCQRFAKWAGHAQEAARIIRKPVTVAPIQMIRQAKGCILRALVQLGKATSILEDGEDVTEAAIRVMFPMIVEECRSDPSIRQRLFLKHAESS